MFVGIVLSKKMVELYFFFVFVLRNKITAQNSKILKEKLLLVLLLNLFEWIILFKNHEFNYIFGDTEFYGTTFFLNYWFFYYLEKVFFIKYKKVQTDIKFLFGLFKWQID